jgi:hypothetical protein
LVLGFFFAIIGTILSIGTKVFSIFSFIFVYCSPYCSPILSPYNISHFS